MPHLARAIDKQRLNKLLLSDSSQKPSSESNLAPDLFDTLVQYQKTLKSLAEQTIVKNNALEQIRLLQPMVAENSTAIAHWGHLFQHPQDNQMLNPQEISAEHARAVQLNKEMTQQQNNLDHEARNANKLCRKLQKEVDEHFARVVQLKISETDVMKFLGQNETQMETDSNGSSGKENRADLGICPPESSVLSPSVQGFVLSNQALVSQTGIKNDEPKNDLKKEKKGGVVDSEEASQNTIEWYNTPDEQLKRTQLIEEFMKLSNPKGIESQKPDELDDLNKLQDQFVTPLVERLLRQKRNLMTAAAPGRPARPMTEADIKQSFDYQFKLWFLQKRFPGVSQYQLSSLPQYNLFREEELEWVKSQVLNKIQRQIQVKDGDETLWAMVKGLLLASFSTPHLTEAVEIVRKIKNEEAKEIAKNPQFIPKRPPVHRILMASGLVIDPTRTKLLEELYSKKIPIFPNKTPEYYERIKNSFFATRASNTERQLQDELAHAQTPKKTESVQAASPANAPRTDSPVALSDPRSFEQQFIDFQNQAKIGQILSEIDQISILFYSRYPWMKDQKTEDQTEEAARRILSEVQPNRPISPDSSETLSACQALLEMRERVQQKEQELVTLRPKLLKQTGKAKQNSSGSTPTSPTDSQTSDDSDRSGDHQLKRRKQ